MNKKIFAFIALTLICSQVMAQLRVVSGASSTTPLAAAGTFTGDWQITSNLDEGVTFKVVTDQDGILYAQFSDDCSTQTNALSYRISASVPEVHRLLITSRCWRIAFTNDSTTAQTSLNLQTLVGPGRAALTSPGNLGIQPDGDAIAVRPSDFQEEVALGRRSHILPINLSSHRDDIDIADGEALIIPDNATNVVAPITTPTTFDITYDGNLGGTTDGAGTTGATDLLFYYLDDNGAYATGTHTLGTDGTDTTTFSGLAVNEVRVIGAGALDHNASPITISATTGGAVLNYLPAEHSLSDVGQYHVATDATAVFHSLFLAANKLSGASPIVLFNVWVWDRNAEVEYEIFQYTMDTQSTNVLLYEDSIRVVVPAGAIIWVTASTSNNDTAAEMRMSLNLYLDE